MNGYRIVDANLNRFREGCRVVEEIFRFILNQKKEALYLKNIRHRFSGKHHYIKDFNNLFLENRDTIHDHLTDTTTKSELDKTNPKEIFSANIKRMQEALRVIEEFAKLFSPELSTVAKKTRYEIYEFEKEAIAFLQEKSNGKS